ncbi:AMP-binding protein [Saccharothrix sp. BKS2]|uniref:AMP-binding protein n=1 Tax=Saccharothrix sp. BKS2 TaxID=3064400 RepID=UPI0039E9A89B
MSPDREALVLGRERRTFGQLRDRAVAVAGALRSELRPEHHETARIALLLGNRPEFLEIFCGGAVAGVPVMVFDPAWSATELSAILRDTPPARLFCTPGSPVGDAPPGAVVEVPGPDFARWRDLPRTASLPEVPDSAPFYVAFTSGSTGRPKGAVRSHRSWLRTFDRSKAEFGIDDTDHVLLPGSLGHSHFLYGALHALHVGATAHLMPKFDAAAVFDQLDRHPITRLYLVPTMFEALLEHASHHPGHVFPGVRSLLSVGAKWSPARRAQAVTLFPGADAVEFYGATELSFVSVLHGDRGGPLDSVGRPVDGVEVSVRSPDGAEVAVGEVGQVHVRSDMLFSGYLSEQDSGGPDADGWFTVADVGRLDEQGYLHLVGRARGMLISGGLNVYPEEVEAALARLDEVAEVAVVGLPDERWGDLVCAAVRWRDGARLTLADVRDRASAHLSRQKCPRRLVELTAMPHTASGKVDRRRVRELVQANAPDVREVR